MEIIGFILGVITGVSLGLIGSGGSILTIPILVYILHISPSYTTTYSLFIVGVSALFGSLKGIKDKLLDHKIALYFGVPSIVSIFIMRKFLMPLVPDVLFTWDTFVVTKDFTIMITFAVLMITASVAMIKKRAETTDTKNEEIEITPIIIKGIVVGLLTGFVGVGGGFLIIPTLLFSAKLPIKNAVATSLIIIGFNSIIGFLGSLGTIDIDWNFLLKFTAFSTLGIFIGVLLSKKISNEKLKPAFGWFVLITGIYIIIKELI